MGLKQSPSNHPGIDLEEKPISAVLSESFTLEDHFRGDGARITDGLCHGRIAACLAVGDHVHVAHLSLPVAPLDADVMTQDNQVALAWPCKVK